jgi:hypothetical protein
MIVRGLMIRAIPMIITIGKAVVVAPREEARV